MNSTELKSKKLANGLTDALYQSANEPSLGFYRIQEHVRKSVPVRMEKISEMNRLKERIQGTTIDLSYSKEAVAQISQADTTFNKIQHLITDSLYTVIVMKSQPNSGLNRSTTSPRTESDASRTSSLN